MLRLIFPISNAFIMQNPLSCLHPFGYLVQSTVQGFAHGGGGQDRVFYGRMDLNMRLFLKFLYLNAEDEIGRMGNFQQKGNRSRICATFNQLLFGP